MNPKAKPFLNPVNEYGLPHWYIPEISVGGESDIRLETPQELCRFYWSLNFLRVRYAYEINNTVVRRDIVAKANLAPDERLWRAPFLYQSAVDEEIVYAVNLRMNKIRRNVESNMFFLECEVYDSDVERTFIFGNRKQSGMTLLDQKSFKTANGIQCCYLYAQKKEWHGKIHNFSVEAIYHEW